MKLEFDFYHPTYVEVTYKFECSACKAMETETVHGVYIQGPRAPDDWTPGALKGDWYCPRHEVEVVVRDKTAEIQRESEERAGDER